VPSMKATMLTTWLSTSPMKRTLDGSDGL